MNQSRTWICSVCLSIAGSIVPFAESAQCFLLSMPPAVKSGGALTNSMRTAGIGYVRQQARSLRPVNQPMISNSAGRLTPPTGFISKSRTSWMVLPCATLTGWATWYSRESCRREGTGGRRILMANNKPLRDHLLTCALPTNITATLNMKYGHQVRVTNLESGRTALLTFTDRGPGRRSLSRGTIIDLTPAAFLAIGGKLEEGRIRIKLQVMK